MAKPLSAKQEAFVNYLTKSDELARHGFELLVQRQDVDDYFDAIAAAGLFEPARNPGPVPAEEEGYVRIPLWPPLDYLVAVAKRSGERNDVALAEKVMRVVRAVSLWRDDENRPRENHHTWRRFAEILGFVPTNAITVQDAGFVGVWVDSRYDRGMVAQALSEGVLNRLLASKNQEDWHKALEILRHCTAIRWENVKDHGRDSLKPANSVDDYWLQKLVRRHAGAFGRRVGAEAGDLFRERIREVFGSADRQRFTRLFRPAVEDHDQNHRWHGIENRPIEGLRDVLLGWCDVAPAPAKDFIEELLRDELEILRRIGVYVMSQRWTHLRDVYATFLNPDLFSAGHLHELYHLLSDHFGDFDATMQTRTIEVIRALPRPDWADDPTATQKRVQQRWLSALANKGSVEADAWFAELQQELGSVGEHPDFESYISVTVGPGRTPYSVQELLALAEQGSLVETLNAFQPESTWRAPTVEALNSALEGAAKGSPAVFLKRLPDFLHVKTRFQHAIIGGLKQAWDAGGSRADVDWTRGWHDLLGFFEQLIGADAFWQQPEEQNGHVPTRDWIVSAIADFLEAGTKDDTRATPKELLPQRWALISILLERVSGVEEPADDAMDQAVNAPRGKAIEALFSQSLHVCRTADADQGTHTRQWAEIARCFESELAKCKNSNYEFSTLAGGYMPQLEYMGGDWIDTHVTGIFTAEFPANEKCALNGLAYATFTRHGYRLLQEHGILDRALHYNLQGRVTEERLLERIAVAYLWGDEQLTAPRFTHLFESARFDALETVAHHLWSFRDETISDDQRERVLRFWEMAIASAKKSASSPARLLSALSTLSCFLQSADGRDRVLLEAVAPYVHIGYNADPFIEELTRLVEQSPEGVSTVLAAVIKANVPSYDYEDHLMRLLERLVAKNRKAEVLSYADRLSGLKGMPELFDRFTRMQ